MASLNKVQKIFTQNLNTVNIGINRLFNEMQYVPAQSNNTKRCFASVQSMHIWIFHIDNGLNRLYEREIPAVTRSSDEFNLYQISIQYRKKYS